MMLRSSRPLQFKNEIIQQCVYCLQTAANTLVHSSGLRPRVFQAAIRKEQPKKHTNPR